ncbi:MAG: hypothetical protein P8102_13055 [Gammaproteobacteria bacterium]
MDPATQHGESAAQGVHGEFVDLDGERYYAIRNVDRMPPFFVSIVSAADHWLFVSSTGGLTAGRVSPDTALVPYVTVDKIHDSALPTGPRTLIRVAADDRVLLWEPFNREQDHLFAVTRNLYKNLIGNKLCFEEINHDLDLTFRYIWATSEAFGFVRECRLGNAGSRALTVDVLDGLQNILPAGTPRFTQTNSSNLVDAYKWTELDAGSGLAMFTLYSRITDRAEPAESLKANVVFSLGAGTAETLLSSDQIELFRQGRRPEHEQNKRGIRGAYFVSRRLELAPQAEDSWALVADVEQTQAQVVRLRRRLESGEAVLDAVRASVAEGSDRLARIMASCDGFETSAEETVSAHHYANVLFNVLRGGYFPAQYEISARDFRRTVRDFNLPVYRRHQGFLDGLPDSLELAALRESIADEGDPQLARLGQEYLPIAFGRRHGDPSRPWNQFEIRVRDKRGEPLLHYEGNWRDIFQNWEALALSYPEFVESMIAKFVNASTLDGHNPYRITKEGIDWEVEDPDDPWSYIGYWGDHQIIYLLKLLEISRSFHPARLAGMLRRPIFAYANVPYRIRDFDALLANPKSTVDYDEALAARIEARVGEIGADGRLVAREDGDVLLVTLMEKLLVPLLAKVGNLVIDGGIWMNTQRPEWNDANNALVGQGLSMVTLCYLRRYVLFLKELVEAETEGFEISEDVARWLDESAASIEHARPLMGTEVDDRQRFTCLRELGEAAARFRQRVYGQQLSTSSVAVSGQAIMRLLDGVLVAVDHSIRRNRRPDGLYHAYNLLEKSQDGIGVDHLYPMLEGQVAVLSSGAMGPRDAVSLLEALFASDIYRPDQHSFMLYPDRDLPGFLEKNVIPPDDVAAIPLLQTMLAEGDERIVLRDEDGRYRFSADFTNAGDLDAQLNALEDVSAGDIEAARKPLRNLFEKVFDHQAFTGRSGTMFGFEGLGCIYWHMVSKLLLAVQECFFAGLDDGADPETLARLAGLYYRVREGLGFNKTPSEYGAFPTDPYSHTPGHNGARQPGMTGQVKEEILTRAGELGLRVRGGVVRFEPALLRSREFRNAPGHLRYLDVDGAWQELAVPAGGLAFTWCQVPVVYRLHDRDAPGVTIAYRGGEQRHGEALALSAEDSASLFRRDGRIRGITVNLSGSSLLQS